MSDVGSKNRPGFAPIDAPQQNEEPRFAPGSSVDRERAWAQNRINNFFRGQAAGRAAAAPQIQLKKDDKTAGMPRTTTGRVPTVDPIPAGNEAQDAKTKKQQKDQLKNEQNLPGAEKHEIPHQPMNPGEIAEVTAKVKAGTATKEEYERLEWSKRFKARRGRGVDRFWAQEKRSLKAGKPGTREWTPEQKAAILNDQTPKDAEGVAMEGHHKHNVVDYPANAADPKNITPVTKNEHLHMWHGGNWQNETAGKPLNPDHKGKS